MTTELHPWNRELLREMFKPLTAQEISEILIEAGLRPCVRDLTRNVQDQVEQDSVQADQQPKLLNRICDRLARLYGVPGLILLKTGCPDRFDFLRESFAHGVALQCRITGREPNRQDYGGDDQ